MSVKLGLYRNKHKLCCSEFCIDLLPHTQDENSTENELLQKLLRPQLSQALLDRERDFKRIYFSTFDRCREEIARSHAHRNRFKLRHYLDIGQKVLYKNHGQDLSKSQRRLGPLAVAIPITSTTYIFPRRKRPINRDTVHRKHLVEYYPKEELLPAMIEDYVPHHQRHYVFF